MNFLWPSCQPSPCSRFHGLPRSWYVYLRNFVLLGLSSLQKLGNTRALSTSDLWKVDQARSAALLSSRLDCSLAQREERSLVQATNDLAGSFFWIGGACKVVADISQMMGPLLVKVLSLFKPRLPLTESMPAGYYPLCEGALRGKSDRRTRSSA